VEITDKGSDVDMTRLDSLCENVDTVTGLAKMCPRWTSNSIEEDQKKMTQAGRVPIYRIRRPPIIR
jgi:hypothetical protein